MNEEIKSTNSVNMPKVKIVLPVYTFDYLASLSGIITLGTNMVRSIPNNSAEKGQKKYSLFLHTGPGWEQQSCQI